VLYPAPDKALNCPFVIEKAGLTRLLDFNMVFEILYILCFTFSGHYYKIRCRNKKDPRLTDLIQGGKDEEICMYCMWLCV
jgi:hypothetical protein